MPFYDPLAAQFANRPLDPWQVSKKNFDFDSGFVGWIRKYLETRKQPCDVVSAKAWINKSKFDGERYELCELQWEAYQDQLQFAESKPKLRALDGDRELHSDHDGATESDAIGAVDAPVEPEIPDKFKRIDGESAEEYRARMARIVSESIKKVGSW